METKGVRRTVKGDPAWVAELIAGLRQDRDEERRGQSFDRFPWLDPYALCTEIDAYTRLARPPTKHLAQAWELLVKDLKATTQALGPHVVQAAGRPLQAALRALSAGPKEIYSARGLQRLRRASGRLSRCLLQEGILSAAWSDLRDTYAHATTTPEDCAWRRRIVSSIGRAVGFDPYSLLWRLGDVLNGSALPVELELRRLAGKEDEQLDVGALIGRESDLPFEERWELCASILAELPPPSDYIVWLIFERARALSGVISVGDVTFYDGHWWQGATATEWPATYGQKPPELEEGGLWVGPLPENGEFVLARVVLKDSVPGDAVERAFAIASALVALAAFHEGRTTWRLQTAYTVHSGQRRISASSNSLPKEQLEKILSGRPSDDRTADRLKGLAQRLPSPLPRTGPLADAVESLLWFEQAKKMPDATRLAMSLRVIDQIAGALSKHWTLFLRDEMKSTWAFRQVMGEIDYLLFVATDAYRSLPRDAKAKAELAEIMEAMGALRHSEALSRPAFIRSIKEIASHPRLTEYHGRDLACLATRIRTGKATARWIDELCDQYDLLVDRSRRVRNAIVHGGPMIPAVVASVSNCLAISTVEALNTWIEGELRGTVFPRAFKKRRQRVNRCHRELKRGFRPELALIWDE